MLHENLIWQAVKRSVGPASQLCCAAIPDLLLHGVEIGLDGQAGGRAEEWGGRGRGIPTSEQSQQSRASLNQPVVMYLFKASAAVGTELKSDENHTSMFDMRDSMHIMYSYYGDLGYYGY